MDCHFIRKKLESRDIIIFINSNEQLANVLTKVSKKIGNQLYLQQPGHMRVI